MTYVQFEHLLNIVSDLRQTMSVDKSAGSDYLICRFRDIITMWAVEIMRTPFNTRFKCKNL